MGPPVCVRKPLSSLSRPLSAIAPFLSYDRAFKVLLAVLSADGSFPQ
jgi:hypothetical protein